MGLNPFAREIMSSIRIRKHIDSDTLTLPELRQYIGRTVEIVIEENPPTTEEVSGEFWTTASKVPESETEFADQQETFRRWRKDARFESHWPMIDHLLARDSKQTRNWAAVLKAAQKLEDYDSQAQTDQHACDIQDAQERMK